MLRGLYTLLAWLLVPPALLRLFWRGRRQPGYRAHLGERLGHYPATLGQAPVWLHAVSVGETRAAAPLVRALLARHPDCWILLTHMTPTGRETAAQLFANEPRVASVYLPYDLPVMMRAFLRRFRPRLGIIMETELWPNLLAACRQEGLPLLLANARLSARSALRYRRIRGLAGEMLQSFAAIGAQSEDDAQRFATLAGPDVRRPVVTGNIKFDIVPDPALLEQGRSWRASWDQAHGPGPVLLIASSREGEEGPLLDAFTRRAPASVRMVIVPRHPQRFDEIARQIEARGLPMSRRSTHPDGPPADCRVWLGDSMGEMFAYYTMADCALLGGSWQPLGGQNLIEPCACQVPVVMGPHTFNFEFAAEAALRAGAALRAADPDAGLAAALEIAADARTRQAMGEAGALFARAHRGATQRTLGLIEQLLDAAGR